MSEAYYWIRNLKGNYKKVNWHAFSLLFQKSYDPLSLRSVEAQSTPPTDNMYNLTRWYPGEGGEGFGSLIMRHADKDWSKFTFKFFDKDDADRFIEANVDCKNKRFMCQGSLDNGEKLYDFFEKIKKTIILSKGSDWTESERVTSRKGKPTTVAKKGQTTFDTPFDRYTVASGHPPRHGGSGTVYKVQDEDGATWALKCLSPQYVTTKKRKRFKNEISFCLGSQHPNIIEVHDWGYTPGKNEEKIPFYVMLFYEKTLRDLIKADIPHEKVLPYFLQILDGVEAAHLLGHWHRDLKPENILYEPSKESIVVADWGIAHFSEDVLLTAIETHDRDRLANFIYAAPEQMKGSSRSVDQRADIYALGMILNEMFTHEPPRGTEYKKIESVSKSYAFLDELVHKMLSNSPDKRPQNIDEIKKIWEALGIESDIRQKLSKLKGTVIPDSELDDPLVNDPVRLVGIDYRDGHLILKLNQTVNKQWYGCFKKTRDRVGYTDDTDPDKFIFSYKMPEAEIPANERYVEEIIDYFKKYLENTNKHYEDEVRERKRIKDDQERAKLREKVADEETRQRISKIKI